MPNNQITGALPVTLPAIATVPRRDPVAVGVNVTLNVQLAPVASDVTQPEAAKSPVAATALIVNVAFPVFVTVIVCAELVVPLA